MGGMDLQEVGYGSMDWIDLPQDRDRWLALVKLSSYYKKKVSNTMNVNCSNVFKQSD